MKRNSLILIALVLAVVALPLQLSYGYESFANLRCGTYMQDGERPQFGVLVGNNSVLLTQKEINVRAMAYTGIFHVNRSDDIQGLATFFVLEKRVPMGSVEFYADFGSGTLWQMKSAEDDLLNADIMVELGIRIKDWFNCGFGLNYLPQAGPDPAFLYFSLNLIPGL